jgi:hypothetical protein
MNNINLVSGKNLNVEKQAQTLKLLRTIAIIMLIGVALVSIVFFVITLLLPIEQVKKSQSQTIQEISGFHKQLATYNLIRDRVSNVKKILAIRKDYPQIIDSILGMLPQDMTVDTLTFDNNILVITVKGQSLFFINQFIDDFSNFSNNNHKIQNLTVKTLQYSPDTAVYFLTFQAKVL